jgi:hypothetical protein
MHARSCLPWPGSISLVRSVSSSLGLCGLLALGPLLGCTLITDVDREKIPRAVAPSFPEVDAGSPDAAPPAPAEPDDVADSGADASSDPGEDAGVPLPLDAGVDAG